MGLHGITHFYGHFESLLRDRRLPSYPHAYNLADEQWRFSQVARLADQIFEPGSPEWRAYLERLLERRVTMSPTFNIYSAGRDVMRARTAEWHQRYTLPSLMRFSAPRRSGLHRTLAEVEVEHIQAVLESVGGNKTRAAEILGVDRKTLRAKLEEKP